MQHYIDIRYVFNVSMEFYIEGSVEIRYSGTFEYLLADYLVCLFTFVSWAAYEHSSRSPRFTYMKKHFQLERSSVKCYMLWQWKSEILFVIVGIIHHRNIILGYISRENIVKLSSNRIFNDSICWGIMNLIIYYNLISSCNIGTFFCKW